MPEIQYRSVFTPLEDRIGIVRKSVHFLPLLEQMIDSRGGLDMKVEAEKKYRRQEKIKPDSNWGVGVILRPFCVLMHLGSYIMHLGAARIDI